MHLTIQISTLPKSRLQWEMTKTQISGHSIWHEQDLDAQGLATFMKSIGECETPDLFMNAVRP